MKNPSNEAAPQEATESAALSKDARTIDLLANTLGIFTSFVVTLFFYLTKKDEDSFIANQSKEALIFPNYSDHRSLRTHRDFHHHNWIFKTHFSRFWDWEFSF
tara:strand:- start:1101 stop:1409 length:309 start_codon:yes stop_codon:yes gene_type:complete